MTTIYFINRFFYPDISSTSQILTDLCEGLAADKSLPNIQVLTSRSVYEGKGQTLAKKEQWQDIKIKRLFSTNFGRKTTIGRLVDYLSFYLSTCLFLLVHLKKNDLVIIKTDPPLLSIPVGWIAVWKKAKTIQWLQDIFPEVAEKLGVKAPKFLFSLLKKLRNQAWLASAHLVVISTGMKQRVSKELPAIINKITVISNWADVNILPIEKSKNPFLKTLAIEDKFIIGYSGNFGSAHCYQELMEAGAYFCKNQEMLFLMIGGGIHYRKLQEAAQGKGWKNWIFLPYQEKSFLSNILSAADVHLVSLNSQVDGYIFPSKIYGIMAVGRPMIFIGDPNGDSANFIQQKQCGVVVTEKDMQGLIDHLFMVKNNQEYAEKMGKNGYHAYSKEQGLAIALMHWKNLLHSIFIEKT